MMGMANAAVFPVPVCAQPNISFPTNSAGIAFAPQDGDTFMELYQKADFALYQVKRSGRDGYRIYK